MLGDLWNRLARGRRGGAVREAEEQQMSRSERRFVDESLEDRQADLSAEAHLGGVSQDHLLEGDEPSHG